MHTSSSASPDEKHTAQIADALRFQETALHITITHQKNEEGTQVVRIQGQTPFRVIITKHAHTETQSTSSAPYILDIDPIFFSSADVEIRIINPTKAL